ncbi:neurexin-2 [Trichonephila clavata]|uniref:Neurexin-2 n=1 Tax=Trichonephila clavata TaxID=2740835 RepID=A0A8X6HV60_TRICU|nr:neurexin-2 [Trichonephila clavata]
MACTPLRCEIIFFCRVGSFCTVLLSVTIDGVFTERGSTAGSFSMLSTSVIYVGGTAPNTAAQLLPASRVRSNFIGCVRKMAAPLDETAFVKFVLNI